MTIQARLMRRKKWYTLEDAAKRLSAETGEEVSGKDVAQFALEGEIDLYVSLTYGHGKRLIHKELAQDSRHSGSLKPWGLNGDYLEDPGRERVAIDELVSLDGAYKVGVNTPAMRGMLLLWVQGYSQEEISDYHDDSWCVFDPKGDAWVVYVSDETIFGPMIPSYKLPEINTLTLLREDVEHFISSLEEEKAPCETHEGEELRALEALGLMTETFAQKAPKYQRSSKPNCAQIAQAMSQNASGIYGMGESKLARLLSDALKAWEERIR